MPEPAKLLQWGYESAIPGTFESYIFALQQKYSVAKRFVTMESASERILKFLASHYKVKSASYKDLTSLDKMEDSPTYNHLAIVDPRLDAFFFNVSGSFSSQVVIFFDDPAELQKLKPSEETLEVPYGAYQLSESMNGYVLSPIATKLSERPILDQNLMGNLITDTDTFFGSRDFYFSNNITHKRGVLMIGFPGVGKTTFLKYYQSHLVDKYSIIIDCSTTYFGPGLFHYLRAVFGSKPKVLILEDVDGACGSMGSRSAFLNFLDGPRELDNTLTIATTNYPERLDDALLDRPSRFDSIYVVGLPNVSLRKEFLIKWFPELQAEPDRLEALALATDGFTGAFFKELKTLAGLRQSSCEEALKAIQDRRKLIEQFGRGIKPKWGMEDKEPPTPMSVWEAPEKMSEPEYAQAKQAFGGAVSSKSTITASIMADYRIDHDLARKLIAASKKV